MSIKSLVLFIGVDISYGALSTYFVCAVVQTFCWMGLDYIWLLVKRLETMWI